MSILRPVRLTQSQYGTSGRLTQDFDGAFYMERPGYLRNDIFPARGARYRWHPNARYRQDLHLGHDYGAPAGASVYAVANGKIIKQGVDGTGGYYIYLRIRTGRLHTITAMYYHLKPASFRYRVGDTVSKGATLAAVGNTGGLSTGAHLHFELWRAPRLTPTYLLYKTALRLDPQPFIAGTASLASVAP